VLVLLRRVARIGIPLAAAAVAFVAPFLVQPGIAPTEFNAIVAENHQSGTDTWRLNRPGYKVADDVQTQIKGYASQPSVNRGGSLVLHISVTPVQDFTADIYRIGWYSGSGARLMQHLGPLHGTTQSACPIDGTTGLRACLWTPSLTVQVPRGWTTGVYLVLLTNAQNYQNYVPFVVRDDSHVGDVIYKQPLNTYQAYNDYPNDQRSGKSLYEQNSYGPNTMAGTVRAVKVSFDRPYADTGAGQLLEWEYSLVRWLERTGYDVSYTTDIDVHANPKSLLGGHAVLSVGHDEYWSRPMYDGMLAARDSGENLAFFGADAGDWQARYESSASGGANRVLVVYRDAALDPESETGLKTVWWRDPPLYRPPQALIGVQFQYLLNANTTYIVNHSDSWVYANTGFSDGDQVANIVGYEVDSAMPNFAFPQAMSGTYALLSASPLVDSNGAAGVSNGSVYRALSGAWVFASGTMSWAWGLEPERNYDPRIQQATANVLNTFLTGSLPTPVPATVLTDYGQRIMQDQPLAYWPLADDNGPIVVDASGSHKEGIRMGGLTTSTQDGFTQSDGTGNVFLPQLPPTVDFTIEGWANLADQSWNQDSFWNNTLYGAQNHVRMLLRPGGTVPINSHGYFGVWLNGTEYALQPLHNGVNNIGTWVYWAMVRQAGHLSVYRNNSLVAERNDLPPDAMANISGQLFAQDASLRLKGALRDVAVYATALSADQIRQRVALAGAPR
jgi:hypothetical protein